MRITYTQPEHDLMDDLSIRQLLILKKIAKLIGSQEDGDVSHAVSLAALLGQGYDGFDSRRILKKCIGMKSIIRAASVGKGNLLLEFCPEAMSIVRKMALQAAECPARGNGETYCEAILALKMSMGIKSDVEYAWKHGHEEFNFGEDVSYMSPAFSDDSWRVSFKNKPAKGLRRTIGIYPVAGGKVQITQTLSSTLTAKDFHSSECLGTIDAGAFINPEERGKLIPGIVRDANDFLDKVRKKMS